MIPIILQAELKEVVLSLFDDKKFVAPEGESRKLSVFEQNLPQKQQKDDSPYPMVIIKLIEGGKEKREDPNVTNVGFIVGTYDENEDNQGYRDAVYILNRLHECFENQPVIGGTFELTGRINWRLHEEDLDPYFFGVMETQWAVPEHGRMDVEELI
ncbi:hypothetical protein EVJ32_09615 [Exiguobacterium sp. SH5S4]|uniref:hypothetical protein n=1 Tax=Exiguobacterium sp. SH5S4 TaxID=2510961 RepID=UPI00103A6877|nr:hypothetical protein [Exiguobacterium sp. SH5S4]TCI25569.1 hypothetical protein EVJ32_09615 [Exiguobacterium sp. SH5S4]